MRSTCDTSPTLPSVRTSASASKPRSSRSTVAPMSSWTATRTNDWISTSELKVGGARRSSTVFCVPRRRASSSPRVTDSMPPIRSDSVGFCIRLCSVLPCAVPISCTPRSAIVRAAVASRLAPISSITITSGMWFSTASIITWCCSSGFGTCIRRALPIPRCGMSPSPPISFEVSTITTRRPSSSAKTRAASRSIVVLPTPGAPSSSTLRPDSTRSRMAPAEPVTARPTRQVSPTIRPRRFRIAEMRCSVLGIPARLSSPNSETEATTWSMSCSVTSPSSSASSRSL